MEQDRRKTVRKSGESLVRFEGENFSIYSRVTNVSEGGAFVATHYLLDPGTTISLHMMDGAGGESTTKAKVVRTSSYKDEQGDSIVGFGVEFVEDITAVH